MKIIYHILFISCLLKIANGNNPITDLVEGGKDEQSPEEIQAALKLTENLKFDSKSDTDISKDQTSVNKKQFETENEVNELELKLNNMKSRINNRLDTMHRIVDQFILQRRSNSLL